MAAACQTIPSPETFAPGILAFLDCEAQVLGARGYQALSATVGATMLGTGLTLLIALTAYRLLLGYVPTIRDGVLTFVKIGLVLVLATSWPAYQVLVYDVTLRAPAELLVGLGSTSGLPGATGGLANRLDAVDQALKSLAIQGVGSPPAGSDGKPVLPSIAPPPFPNFDMFALGWSRVGFLVGALASFAVVRISAGLLLALGPVFAVFLLFDGTRGLFGGWLRSLIATALAALAISVVLGVELAFLEPWLANLLARRASGLDILGAPAQLLASSMIFAIALIAVVLVVARIGIGLRIPGWNMRGVAPQPLRSLLGQPQSAHTSFGPPGESRSRAIVLADAIASTQRREEQLASGAGKGAATMVGGSGGRASTTGNDIMMTARARSSSKRRTTGRVSAGAAARDRGR